MFERFTEKSRLAVVAAQDFARSDRHNEITVWDLLVALRLSEGIAGKVLERYFPSVAALQVAVRDKDDHAIPRGDAAATVGQIPFSPETKQALERALRQSLQMGHNFIGTEHVLLGLCDVARGYDLIPDYDECRESVLAALVGRTMPEDEVRAAMELPEVEEAQAKARYEVIRIEAPQFILVIDGVVSIDDRGQAIIFYDEDHALSTAERWTA